MAGLEKLSLPIRHLICQECLREQLPVLEDTPTLYSLFDFPIRGENNEELLISVDVEAVEWIRMSNGRYEARAAMKIACPCCESIRFIKYHLEASRVVLSSIGQCQSCGNSLRIENDNITYDGRGPNGPSIKVTASLICSACCKEEERFNFDVSPEDFLGKNGRLSLQISSAQKVVISQLPKDEPRNSRSLLLVIANPVDSGTLRLATECRVIEQSIERSKNRDSLHLKIIQAATIDDWAREMLEQDFNIVHFSGHGSNQGLALEDEQGGVKIVPTQGLGKMIAAYQSVECVLLNACFSASHLESELSQIGYAIVNSEAISDSAAIEFSRGFYDSIGAGKSIEFSFREGCRRIELKGLPSGRMPALFVRGARFLPQATFPAGENSSNSEP